LPNPICPVLTIPFAATLEGFYEFGGMIP
jgi:hypothetical protein